MEKYCEICDKKFRLKYNCACVESKRLQEYIEICKERGRLPSIKDDVYLRNYFYDIMDIAMTDGFVKGFKEIGSVNYKGKDLKYIKDMSIFECKKIYKDIYNNELDKTRYVRGLLKDK